ncbi:MAG: MFS transporter [Flavobacteriales bacterium]|nr:MFS transporter [Flavobacteriales bacterium]
MAKTDPYQALRNKEFRLFLVIRFAMVLAWTMQFIVIEWEVYSLTKDPLALGIIGLMEIIPAVSLALFAGHIVDQKEKRKMLMWCLAGFFTISTLLFVTCLPSIQNSFDTKLIVGAIYVLVFFGGAVRSFISPTIFSLFSLVVPKKDYANGATWSSSVWQMGSVVGPALGGFSILWIGVHWSMFVIIGFTILAFVLLTQIESKPILNTKIGEPIGKSLKEGLKFVFNTKEILGAITLDMVAVLFGGAVALLPVFAQDILKVGPTGFGFLRAAPAIGSFITIIIIAYFPITVSAGKKLLFAIFGFGLSIIVFGISDWFIISLLALFFSGVFDGVSVVIRQTILQLKTPDNMRGRVASVNSMFVGSSNELGAFESGLTAKLMGTVNAVIFGGVMTCVIVAGSGFVFPQLRKLDLSKADEDE